MTTYNYYPKDLPLALQSSYSVKYAPSILRTEMTDGTVRQRLLNVGAPATLTCNILFSSQAEYAKWVTFYKTLNYGTDWFVMPCVNEDCNTENNISYRLIRIQKGAYTSSLQFNNGNIVRQISITCDVDELTYDSSWSNYYND